MQGLILSKEWVQYNIGLNDVQGKVTACGAAAVAAAATRNEQIKEMFMDMGVDELLIHLLTKYAKDDEILHVACDAIRSLVTDDDQRPATSKVGNINFSLDHPFFCCQC